MKTFFKKKIIVLKDCFLNRQEKKFYHINLSNLKKKKITDSTENKIIVICGIWEHFFLLVSKILVNFFTKKKFKFVLINNYVIKHKTKSYLALLSNYLSDFLWALKWEKLFFSVGIDSCIKLNLNKFNYKEKTLIKNNFNQILKSISNKTDILNLKIDNILYGDLLYDTYLRFGHEKTLNSKDWYLKKLLWQLILIHFNLKKFFKKNRKKIHSFYCMYSSYLHYGIPARFFSCNKINSYSIVDLDKSIFKITKITKLNNYKHVNTKSEFINKKIKIKNKKNVIRNMINDITNRINYEYKKTKGFRYLHNLQNNYSKKKFVKYKKLIGVVFLHDFKDQNHFYNYSIFSDYYEWADFTCNIISKYNLNIGIKPHPNESEESNVISNLLKKKYSNLVWIDKNLPNSFFAKNRKFKFGVSVGGSILSELIFFKKIPIFIADFYLDKYLPYKKPKTKLQYINYLKFYSSLKLPPKIAKISLEEKYKKIYFNNSLHKLYNTLNHFDFCKLFHYEFSQNILNYNNQIDNFFCKNFK